MPIKMRAPRWREDWTFTQPPSFYKMSIKPELSWSVSWSRKHRSWFKDMMIDRSNWLRCDRWQAQMVKQADANFQEVFSQVSLADSMKLLPWCISSAVLLHYMSRALATTAQQDEDVPATTTASEPKDSLAQGPSSSQACLPRTPPLPVPSLPDILFVGTPPVGCPFAEFLPIPT